MLHAPTRYSVISMYYKHVLIKNKKEKIALWFEIVLDSHEHIRVEYSFSVAFIHIPQMISYKHMLRLKFRHSPKEFALIGRALGRWLNHKSVSYGCMATELVH